MPECFASAASVADGIEIKLDWHHIESWSAEHTLADECVKRGVEPAAVTSIHLPPGTIHRQGMSVAPGNVGIISDFANRQVGDGVKPDWLTIHTVREFDYYEQVDRLATLTNVGGYPLAIENLPEPCYYHTPEDVAALAVLAEQVPELDDVSVLIDTAHVPTSRREPVIDETALNTVLKRLDGAVREQMASSLPEFLDRNIAICDEFDPGVEPPAVGSPWRPVYTMFALVGGSQVRAVHLNDPATDGLPAVGEHTSHGLQWVLEFCYEYGIAVVLEPGEADRNMIVETIEGLRALL